jgi:hypothetical protein
MDTLLRSHEDALDAYEDAQDRYSEVYGAWSHAVSPHGRLQHYRRLSERWKAVMATYRRLERAQRALAILRSEVA